MLNCTLQKPTVRMALFDAEPFCDTADEDTSFEITELNTDGENQLYGQKTGKQKRYAIIWIRDGIGKLLVDIKQHDFRENTIFFLQPGQLHRLSPQTVLRGHFISFSASFLNMSEIFKGLADSEHGIHYRFFKTIIDGHVVSNDLQELVQEMMNESVNHDLLGTEVLRGLLGVFMVHLARNNSGNTFYTGINHDEQLAKKFKGLLNEKICARKMVSDYANELAISPNYLNQVMKRYTGFTASQHIQQHTILEAKRRAMHFGTTMKEIAYYLGFDDLAHFSKFFKKNAGTSFREFKNQITDC